MQSKMFYNIMADGTVKQAVAHELLVGHVRAFRPETILGDTAVAVHPEDERYRHLIGKKVVLPLIGREIPVVADEYVELEFGTGVVKITPAHDFNDFEVGRRHGLEFVTVIGFDAKMTLAAGDKYAGMDRFECRKAIDLRKTLPGSRSDNWLARYWAQVGKAEANSQRLDAASNAYAEAIRIAQEATGIRSDELATWQAELERLKQ